MMGVSLTEAHIIRALDFQAAEDCLPEIRLSIKPSVRRALLERDGYKCGYCGASDRVLVLDHIWPVSKGGETETHNLLTACRICNSSKHADLLVQWQYRMPEDVCLDYAFSIFHGESI